MDATFKPRSSEETAEIVRWAAAEETPLEITGQGSKRALGHPVQAAHMLSMEGLAGIESYEPAELILTAKAGTPIAEIEALLADYNQELSFEPMDYGPLLGQVPGAGTVGGVVAANLAGPRRVKAGAARDHILGMEAISGRGEKFVSGGKVVKNVTGYDLPRALCGSWGTLAAATEITLKVNPAPEISATFSLSGLSNADAVATLCKAMGSAAEVSGAAHLPAGIMGDEPKTVLRLEGFSASVDDRFKALTTLFSGSAPITRLEDDASRDLWARIRDVVPFQGLQGPVWRISVAPSQGAQLASRLSEQIGGKLFFDWSGGLVWLCCDDGGLHDALIRKTVAGIGGGHATLIRADAAARSSVPVFEPQPEALAALSGRVKQQFDPKGVLNPGRMVAGQ